MNIKCLILGISTLCFSSLSAQIPDSTTKYIETFLLKNDTILARDTAYPINHRYQKYIIKKWNNKEHSIGIYSFRWNYTVSREYLLVIHNNKWKVLGNNNIQDFYDLYRLFSIYPKTKKKVKLRCYEILAGNRYAITAMNSDTR